VTYRKILGITDYYGKSMVATVSPWLLKKSLVVMENPWLPLKPQKSKVAMESPKLI
jgi:hypothetical protein